MYRSVTDGLCAVKVAQSDEVGAVEAFRADEAGAADGERALGVRGRAALHESVRGEDDAVSLKQSTSLSD